MEPSYRSRPPPHFHHLHHHHHFLFCPERHHHHHFLLCPRHHHHFDCPVHKNPNLALLRAQCPPPLNTQVISDGDALGAVNDSSYNNEVYQGQEHEGLEHAEDEEGDDDPIFVLTDEWKEFFAISEAKRKLEKKQGKKKNQKHHLQ